MRRGLLIGLLAGWLLGIGTGLGYVALSGGGYEHHVLDTGDDYAELVNMHGWEPIPGVPSPYEIPAYYRRPRFRLP